MLSPRTAPGVKSHGSCKRLNFVTLARVNYGACETPISHGSVQTMMHTGTHSRPVTLPARADAWQVRLGEHQGKSDGLRCPMHDAARLGPVAGVSHSPGRQRGLIWSTPI